MVELSEKFTMVGCSSIFVLSLEPDSCGVALTNFVFETYIVHALKCPYFRLLPLVKSAMLFVNIRGTRDF